MPVYTVCLDKHADHLPPSSTYIIPSVPLLICLPVAVLLCPAVISSCRAGAMLGGCRLRACLCLCGETTAPGKRIAAKPQCQQSSYKSTPVMEKKRAFPIPKAEGLAQTLSTSATSGFCRHSAELHRKTLHLKLKHS